jgi:VCBS repeat-containing protein
MSTTKTTSGLTATSLSNKLAVSSGLSTSDLFALDNAKVLSAPGTAKCEEAGANKGYLNAIGAADGTYITISIAGSGAVKGDIVEFYLGGKLAATHELTAIEVSNIATSPATTNTGVKDWSLPPEPKPGVAAVLVSADVLATYLDGKYDMTSRIYSVGTGTYSAISTGVGRLNLDRKAPTAPTAPIATDDVGQLTGVIAQNATTDDANPLISGTAKESGSSISVYDNGVFLGNAVVSTTGAWTFVPTTPLINGPHAITLIETDIAGNPSPMSAPLNFIVDTGVANVVITHASDNVGDLQGNVLTGGITDDKTPTLVGTAKANAVVTILEGSTIVGTTTADGQGNWSFTPSGAQTEGTHTYTASTTVAGNTVTSVDFVITVDTVAPNVVVTPQGDNLKTADEATAATGIITVNAELGSTSTVTFVGQHGQVTKTVNNIGSPRPVVLTAADLVTLGDGAVEVTTVTKDKAGNTTTTADINDGDFTLDTVAAVAVADVVNATEDLVSTSGNVGTNDTSKDGSETFSLVGSATGLYGTLVLGANGTYTYTRTSNLDAIQTTVVDTFTYQVRDGAGNTTQSTLKINMAPVNDAAVISGTVAGDVVEAGGLANAVVGTPTATGTLTSLDVDGVNNAFTAVVAGTASTGGYGTYAMTANGVWTYKLDNANAKVQGLTLGATLQDTFTVAAADGTPKTITITITGTNDAAVISGPTTGDVIEAGGVANAVAGTPTATGTLTSFDVDGANNAFIAVTAGTASTGGYGTYAMAANGVWTYTLNNNDVTVQALTAGAKLNDTFTVKAADGTAKTVTVTISGTNDAAVISGNVVGSVTEASGGSATGTLTSIDVDGTDNAFTAVAAGTASYGTYAMTAGGVWTYTLDNSNPTVQGLTPGATLQDTFTVTAADGTAKTINVTISGTNTAAVISGPVVGAVTEAGGVANAIAGTPTATGTLSSTDVDGASNAFTAVTTGTTSISGYGTYTMTANGVWTYTLNNNNITVQALTTGAKLQDTFTITAADGTPQTITVTITGTNDAAVISGAITGDVIEAGGVANAVAGTPTATGTLLSSDVDGLGNTFTAVTAGTAMYGTYTMTAGGVWTYKLDNANGTVQGLTSAGKLTDTFTLNFLAFT